MPTINVLDIILLALLAAILGSLLGALGLFETIPAYVEAMVMRFEYQWEHLFGKLFSAIPFQIWMFLAFVPIVTAILKMLRAV